MDIITLMTNVVEELFSAGQKFMEEPENFAMLEASADEISRKMAVEFIRMTLEETDEVIRKSLLRKEGYNIQRKKKRSLITTVGDVTYERTLFKAKETGETKTLLDVMMETSEHLCRITYKDSGIPYNPLEAEAPDLSLDVMDMPVGGLGIFMVREMMDVIT